MHFSTRLSELNGPVVQSQLTWPTRLPFLEETDKGVPIPYRPLTVGKPGKYGGLEDGPVLSQGIHPVDKSTHSNLKVRPILPPDSEAIASAGQFVDALTPRTVSLYPLPLHRICPTERTTVYQVRE